MTAAKWVIGFLGATETLAWLGMWAEVLLLQIFSQSYFTSGPVLLEKTGVMRSAAADSDVRVPDMDLPEFATSRGSPATILVRRKLMLGHFRPNIAPLWSARMELTLEAATGATVIHLRVRHGLCWPVFVGAPTLGAVCALALNPSWGLLCFLLACVAFAAVPILASLRVAKRDADRVWDAVTRVFTEPLVR
jgi:hypothetical protein